MMKNRMFESKSISSSPVEKLKLKVDVEFTAAPGLVKSPVSFDCNVYTVAEFGLSISLILKEILDALTPRRSNTGN